jgi:3-oxoacyl-[acyl-carrier protein] reductase
MSILMGKRAIVLCGTSGIGLGIANELKQAGAQVAVTGRDLGKLELAKKKGNDFGFSADHSVPGKTTEAVQMLTEALGGLDVLVLNSPPPPKGKFEALSIEQWQEGVQKILLSAVEAIQAALPSLKQSESPRIIFSLSTAAKEPIAGLLVSSTIRAGMLGMVKTLSREFAEYKITVNALLPGYTQTEDAVIQKSTGLAEQIPLKRLATPNEHGKLVAFLASPDAAYLTGQVIANDGGLLQGI